VREVKCNPTTSIRLFLKRRQRSSLPRRSKIKKVLSSLSLDNM